MAKRQQEKVGICKNCKKKIHQSSLQPKWFHDDNFSSFCYGMAFKVISRGKRKGEREPSPVAEPTPTKEKHSKHKSKERDDGAKPAGQRRDNRDKRARPEASASS